MSFLTTLPEGMVAAAGALSGMTAGKTAAQAATAAGIQGVVPPAADPTSAVVAALLQAHGMLHQAMQGAGTAVEVAHAATVVTSAGSYVGEEVASIATLL